MGAVLHIGNRNYSSWSLRGWLLARMSGLAFEDRMIPLYTPETKSRVLEVSPSGMLPCLHHNGAVVWDSLAIAEYLHEHFPQSGIWPANALSRAHARSISAEMHSGFADLRRAMPMDIHGRNPGRSYGPEVHACIARITAIWADCRARFGAGGPYLFGAWSGADCMYAPVVMRFRTYAPDLDVTTHQYMDAVCAQKDVAEWVHAAAADTWTIDWDAAARAGVAPSAQRKT